MLIKRLMTTVTLTVVTAVVMKRMQKTTVQSFPPRGSRERHLHTPLEKPRLSSQVMHNEKVVGNNVIIIMNRTS